MAGGLVGTTQDTRGIVPFARVLAVGIVVLLALSHLPQFPIGIGTLLVAVCALAALASAKIGIISAIVVIGYPLFYANPVLGAIFVVVGLAAVPFLAADDGLPFYLIGGSILALAAHAEWAVPILAGFYLGTAEGVAVGIVTAVGIELAGVFVGQRFTGTLFTHGSRPLLKFANPNMPSITQFGWIMTRYEALPPARLFGELAKAFASPAMLIQPLLWGASAGVTGALSRWDLKRGLAAAGAGVALLLFGQAVIFRTLGTPEATSGQLVSTLVSSVVVSAVFMIASTLFKRRQAGLPAFAVQTSMAPVAQQVPKEADVVDLLRTISHAEEQIREKYMQTTTMLLTDMKEFSKMTTEQGNIPSAKTVQRHRDLLIPVIEANGGSGKPTGGDGIMAVFDDARSAIQAAVDMQRALARYNATATEDTRVLIRIGINTGEVVFDKGGTPFIGDGLNTSARVMGLADGGQILVTKATFEEASQMGDFKWQYLGTRDLKGVAVGAHIYEIVWQQAADTVSPAPQAPLPGPAV